MTKNNISRSQMSLVFTGLIALAGMCGCQTHMAGQTLPSAYYLRDDVQYFPAGPETQLPNTRRAIQEYKASQDVLAEDLELTR